MPKQPMKQDAPNDTPCGKAYNKKKNQERKDYNRMLDKQHDPGDMMKEKPKQ